MVTDPPSLWTFKPIGLKPDLENILNLLILYWKKPIQFKTFVRNQSYDRKSIENNHICPEIRVGKLARR